MSNKISLSFSSISEALHQFPFPETDLVIGIGRGGIVPASLVAHQLQCELHIVHVNYRNDENQPVRFQPEFLHAFAPDLDKNMKILLVDDVSVTGKTLAIVKEKLSGYQVTTFVMKGKADLALFPEITSCVNWPWKEQFTHVF